MSYSSNKEAAMKQSQKNKMNEAFDGKVVYSKEKGGQQKDKEPRRRSFLGFNY